MAEVNLTHITLPSNIINVGSVIKVDGLNKNNTVLDPLFEEHGGIIDFGGLKLYDNWKRIVKGLVVPPLPITYEMQNESIAVLHPLAVRANVVCRMLHEVKTGTKKFESIQKAVNAYYLELCLNIFGKGGTYNRNILGPRLKRSFRAVAVPGRYTKDLLGESYEWVGIPSRIFDRLKITEGDIVVIGRDPTIWMGSIEFLYAYRTDHDSIEIHPLILPQLGGDHDGDQFWGFYPKQDLLDKVEVAGFTRKHATWGKNLNHKHDTVDVDWSNFANDEKSRLATTGLSVSPSDILTNNDSLHHVLAYCAKGKRTRGKVNDVEDLREIAKGIELGEWKKRTEAVNAAQLAMKIFMGPVGLLALRLLVIGEKNEDIRESAHVLAERCAQGLLDAKHLTYGQVKNFKPARIFEIVNLTDQSLKTSHDMLKALQAIVPCDERVLPILDYLIKDGRGLAKMSKEDSLMFEGITSTAELDSKGYMPPEILANKFKDDEGIFTYAFLEGSKDE